MCLKQNSRFTPSHPAPLQNPKHGLFLLTSAPSPNPQQTPLSLFLKYGLNMPTFLHCHCHHPNINHKFLSGYLPTSHCFPNSTPHNSLFAEQPKQSFKSKSGPLSLQLQDLHQLPTAHLQWNPNPFNSHTRAALANLSSFIPNHSTPYPPCHGPTNFLLFFKHDQVVPPKNFALANLATSTALHGRLHLVWDLFKSNLLTTHYSQVSLITVHFICNTSHYLKLHRLFTSLLPIKLYAP